MSAFRPRASDWIVVLACVLAAALGFSPQRAARAEDKGKATSTASAKGDELHGLHPLFEDREVPHKMLPPGAQDPDTGPSSVIYPPQKITLRFNHKEHVKGQSLKCELCHGGAKKSVAAADNLLPDGTTCDTCHDTDHSDVSNVTASGDYPCSFCHLGYHEGDKSQVVSFEMPKPNMTFSHKAHLDRNIACAQCHGSIDELELATRDQLPRMKGCFSCHQMAGPAQGEAKSDCNVCHLTTPDGRMKTMFASGTLEPPRWLHNAEHSPDFIERHKRVAADDSKFCASCHTEKFCTDCHDGRVRPRSVHPNDFISMHPIAARQDNPRCSSCHQEQSFCLQCHQRLGVTLQGPNPVAGTGRSFHPPGWNDLTVNPNHHSYEAQRNISACVSCHTERDCLVCHASNGGGASGLGRGLGLDPHPAGFVNNCSSLLRRNARPCYVCHDPTDSVLAQCR